MDTKFRQYLIEHQFDRTEIDNLLASASLLELPTRHILTHQGEHNQSVYFLLEGLCRASYLTADGKEFSKEFYWEHDWIIGFESVILQHPSPYLVESLTPIIVVEIPLAAVQIWRKQGHPIYLKLLENQLIHKEHKERFMLLYSPEQRYLLFCQQFPDLLPRLTDQHIAAYLGITPISLSRIKARLKKSS
ncbi:Crp/Fnr family transcriptional regulator [Photobacterium damselae]|uniref:Crp/Fnr family transcriptional regulator n=1 Tax=Photobacterium damselae TaxID=38293 RepID=UPI000D069132|nr:Crp/Fnr family transcriptional regulator [Photobacterium damselae]NVH50257.1 Crp/Fnr family transcriptional regulator [Photobacterium damselae subsp. damselae]NVO82940.1 Crp/Fnr family transcriptional regulator [Photobacterium damselae subsp. damselae]PSB86124.1 Crp/Fnr family transcriptional regulator [Photobacterium damselae subsp. damselae]